MEITQAMLIVVTCYLLGSIPTAYIVARLRGVNIFAVGSGNMGATNIARALGKRWGIAVLLVDAIKGIVAILMARYIVNPQESVFVAETQSRWGATVLAAVVVVIGHNWSLFATLITKSIRGGKGAATTYGTFLTMAPIFVVVGLTFIGTLVIARTRYVSLGVLVMSALGFIWMMVLAVQQVIPLEYTLYLLAMGLMILVRFRENIQRLLRGTERRFGERV
jgi:glycerol-3-phosphate acyltransferase PlsY